MGRHAMRFDRLLSLRVILALIMLGAAVTTGVLAFISYSSSAERAEASARVVAETEQISLLREIQGQVLGQSAAAAAYMTLRDPELIDAFNRSTTDANSSFEELRTLAEESDPDEASALADLESAYQEYTGVVARVLQQIEAGNEAEAFALVAESGVVDSGATLVSDVNAAVAGARADLVQAQEQANAAARRADRITLTIAALWTTLLVGGGFATYRGIIRPIDRLRAATRAIAAGDETTRAPVAGPAELRDLSRDVNHMADAIIERSQELQSYLSLNLEERTLQLQRANAALRESEQRFRSLVQNASDMIVIVNDKAEVTYASPAVEHVMGYTADDWRGLNVLTIIHPDELEGATQSLKGVLREPGVHPPTTVRVRHKNGSWRYVELIATNLLDDPAVRGVVYNARDVTDRLAAEEAVRESERRFRSLVQNASDMITVIDPDTAVRYQSPSVTHILGHSPDDISGRPVTDILHPDDQRRFLQALAQAAENAGDPLSIEVRLQHKDGSWRHMEVMVADNRREPAIGAFVLNSRDVTDRIALEEQLRQQAFHDPLTKLANRARFTDRLEHALVRAHRTRGTVAVLFLDLDNFKAVNDSLGHATGDQLLVQVACRLEGALRPEDTIARFGGDEFAILLEETTPEGAEAAAERVLQVFQPAFLLEGREIMMRASVGVATSRRAGDVPDDLLRDADIAMYMAKRRGKGRYEVYESGMSQSMVERLELLADLQHALEREEFALHYQPTIDLHDGRMVGMEALVRWRHPGRGLLPPTLFIPLAEESGAIHALGVWVLREACKQAKRWQERYESDPPWSMSVNVSVMQIQPRLVGEVAQVLEETGLDPGTLILEVTESVMMQDATPVIKVLEQIRALGVRIAIDDFGTGYSSLSYLQNLPFDLLKIDRSFVTNSSEDRNGNEITRAIIGLGKTLHVGVIAEGIETDEQLVHLRQLECEFGQGFYFSQPLDTEGMERLLEAERARRQAA